MANRKSAGYVKGYGTAYSIYVQHFAFQDTYCARSASQQYSTSVWVLENLCSIFDNNPDAHHLILWTNEVRFTNMVNREINRHWADENLYITNSTRRHVICSINVWCELLENMLIGQNFYHGNLNTDGWQHLSQVCTASSKYNSPRQVNRNTGSYSTAPSINRPSAYELFITYGVTWST